MPECPVDRIDMRVVALPAGVAEYLCARCDGLWLPGRLVYATLGAVPLERIRQAGATRTLRCPHDGNLLQALHHHGIEIDACPYCAGAWLDAGERDRILAARAPPSLARRFADGAADSSGIADIADTVLEFVGDVLSGL